MTKRNYEGNILDWRQKNDLCETLDWTKYHCCKSVFSNSV